MHVAWVVGASALTGTVLLILFISALRTLRARDTARRERLLARWRPLLMSALDESNPPLPIVQPRDQRDFLLLWNHLHESLRGDAKQGLNRIALRLGMEKVARRMLAAGATDQRLIGTITLGNLRNQAAWGPLLEAAQSDAGVVGLAAVRALFRIDAEEAAAATMLLLGQRRDWSVGRVLTLLKEAGPGVVSQPLADALGQADARQAARLLEFTSAAEHRVVRPAILGKLARTRDPEVVAACLRHLKDPRDADHMREALTHPSWFVRGQALRALRPFVTRADVPQVIGLLADEEWWVRLRAAELLLSLDDVDSLVADADPAARALLAEVRAQGGAP